MTNNTPDNTKRVQSEETGRTGKLYFSFMSQQRLVKWDDEPNPEAYCEDTLIFLDDELAR